MDIPQEKPRLREFMFMLWTFVVFNYEGFAVIRNIMRMCDVYIITFPDISNYDDGSFFSFYITVFSLNLIEFKRD